MCVSGRVAEMRALEQRKAYRSQTADGGYSGGNTDRPALQWLLDEFLPTDANAPERPLRQTALSKETTHAHETRLIRVIPRRGNLSSRKTVWWARELSHIKQRQLLIKGAGK